jgi:hypothetical protein
MHTPQVPSRHFYSEYHTLHDNRHERSSDYTFVMQCWTRDELDSYLTQSGFLAPTYFGAYDIDVAAERRIGSWLSPS